MSDVTAYRLGTTSWIDLHTHLNFLETSPDEAIELAQKNGVERLITIGTCPSDLPIVMKLAADHNPIVWCTLGIHPHDAKEFNTDVDTYLQSNVQSPLVVAVGEIGLDFYYDNSPRDEQIKVFRRQLEIAREFHLPVQVHTRDAELETVEVLKEFRGEVKGVIHCFTGTQWLADQVLDLGFNISISGVVTFKNADELRGIVQRVPIDRLHVETDSPFLTPVPLRGRKNTSAYVVHVAEKVAELKNVTVEQLAAQTKENALKMFTKIQWN
ncbi:MAG: TatD family hydrolase [Bdellovibrionales bacterium]|nr:TatD family hydrolase [Bdellovibrionales bacterium]